MNLQRKMFDENSGSKEDLSMKYILRIILSVFLLILLLFVFSIFVEGHFVNYRVTNNLWPYSWSLKCSFI